MESGGPINSECLPERDRRKIKMNLLGVALAASFQKRKMGIKRKVLS